MRRAEIFEPRIAETVRDIGSFILFEPERLQERKHIIKVGSLKIKTGAIMNASDYERIPFELL